MLHALAGHMHSYQPSYFFPLYHAVLRPALPTKLKPLRLGSTWCSPGQSQWQGICAKKRHESQSGQQTATAGNSAAQVKLSPSVLCTQPGEAIAAEIQACPPLRLLAERVLP